MGGRAGRRGRCIAVVKHARACCWVACRGMPWHISQTDEMSEMSLLWLFGFSSLINVEVNFMARVLAVVATDPPPSTTLAPNAFAAAWCVTSSVLFV